MTRGVTRTKQIVFFNSSTMHYPDKVFSSPGNLSGGRFTDVDGQAAVLVDDARDVSKADEKSEAVFASWTKRLCGVSPEALSHMHESTIGCDCSSTVPTKYKDLKWWSSAVAGKSRHSSHPSDTTEYTHFRECVGMDFLEFKIEENKFHVQAFVDYKTGYNPCR